jgi:hypothetical protein
MTTRTGNGRPRLVASAAGRAPAVHLRYRMRLQVDPNGWVKPRSADDRHGFMETYKPGTVVEVDLGMASVLTDYDALFIAESLAQCKDVYLISAAADGSRPHVERGTAFNADGVLYVLRRAIERVAAGRDTPAC